MNQTQALPPALYRSEAFAEDLEPPAPLVARRGPFGRPGRARLLTLLPAVVALASTAAALLVKPA